VEAALEELAQQEQALSALRASINRAALKEDAAAEVKLAAAGQQLDGLANSLQALESRQAALQVGALGGKGNDCGCCQHLLFLLPDCLPGPVTFQQAATTSCHLAPPVLRPAVLPGPVCRLSATIASTLRRPPSTRA
jgi:hypothetical protein